MKGNEKDCICSKTDKGNHKKYCDAYRLSQFLIEVASVLQKKKIIRSRIENL
jgi:hypothetical protein